MRTLKLALTGLLLVMSTQSYTHEDKRIVSGPQPGERLPEGLYVLNVHNSEAPAKNGTKSCIICQYQTKVVVLIFSQKITDQLTKLVKQLEREVIRTNKEFGVSFVFLTREKNAEEQLRKYIQQERYKQVTFALDQPSGPSHFKLADQALTTILIYKEFIVQANHVYSSEELTDSNAILEEVSNCLRKRLK